MADDCNISYYFCRSHRYLLKEFPKLEGAYQDMLREMTSEEAEAQLKVCALRQAEASHILTKKREKWYEMRKELEPVCFLHKAGSGK